MTFKFQPYIKMENVFPTLLNFFKCTTDCVYIVPPHPLTIAFSVSPDRLHLDLHSCVLHHRAIHSDTLSAQETNILHGVAGQKGDSR